MTIRRAAIEDIDCITALAGKLWPDADNLKAELAPLLRSAEAIIFLCHADGQGVAFAQCQLRHDYVEGTDSSPVGYLEGVYVEPEYRSNGIAKALLSRCEAWARGMGCTEFASDCQLDNIVSWHFHKSMGFEEAGRIICFTKQL